MSGGLRRAALLVLLTPLAACINMSGLSGESKYDCKAPEGIACDSVSGTYANAMANNLPGQLARQSLAKTAMPDLLTVNRPEADASSPATVDTADRPLRAQARVLRLWIKPWEDADDDLYDQSYVFVHVDNGRWLIDHVTRDIRNAYAPLKPPSGASSEPAPAGNMSATSPASMTPTLPQRPGPAPAPVTRRSFNDPTQ